MSAKVGTIRKFTLGMTRSRTSSSLRVNGELTSFNNDPDSKRGNPSLISSWPRPFATAVRVTPQGFCEMPTGPKGEKRPADVIGNAVKVMRILTGEEPEDFGDAPAKDQAAVKLGRKGGKKRAESMTPERRAEIAKKAAQKRWKTSATE